MFDFAWSELAVIAMVALVVIGPKDLPRALKTLGFVVRRARQMAREFQNSVDDMIRESELADVSKSLSEVTNPDLGRILDPGIAHPPAGGVAPAIADTIAAPEPSPLVPTPSEHPIPTAPESAPIPAPAESADAPHAPDHAAHHD